MHPGQVDAICNRQRLGVDAPTATNERFGLAAFFEQTWADISVVVALGGSLLVSYTRARGESLGVLCKGGTMQRAERILLLGVGSIVDPALSQALGKEKGFVIAIIVAVIAWWSGSSEPSSSNTGITNEIILVWSICPLKRCRACSAGGLYHERGGNKRLKGWKISRRRNFSKTMIVISTRDERMRMSSWI